MLQSSQGQDQSPDPGRFKESIRQSLGGVSEADRATLAAKPHYDTAKDLQKSAMRRLDGADRALEEALAGLDGLSGSDEVPDGLPTEIAGPLGELVSTVSLRIQDMANRVKVAKADLHLAREEGSALAGVEAHLAEAHGAFDASYQSVKATSSAHEAKLAELAEVERRVNEAKALRASQATERSRLGDPETSHQELRSEMTSLAKERSATVAAECLTMDQLSDGLIHAELQRGVGLSGPAERFRAGISGSGVRTARIDAFFEALQNEEDPLDTWNEVLDELESILQLDPETAVKSSNTPVMSRLGFPVADQDKVRTRLTSDGWLDLALTPVLDRPTFRYQVKESDFIDFSDASAGQQATALLRVLLAQPGPPLIIDQPEDDLDSQVVLDVVKRLWASKGRRQLIFSSHNANLVVNGDAELVVVCENRQQGDQSGGYVGHQGAIDVQEIRAAVTQVMEGGEEAFKLRKEKYGF